jgi:hypothetical protein
MSETDGNRPLAGRVNIYENKLGETHTVSQISLPGDHPYYALIGRVASEWTHFEHILDEIIWDIAEIPENIALCITGQIMGATPRFKMIEALGKHLKLPEELLREAKKLKGAQYEIAEQRNRIVHDPWFEVREKNGAGLTTQLKSSPPGYEAMSREDIQATLDHIRRYVVHAANLQVKFRKTLHALREKPSAPPPASPEPAAR